ncbi:MAG: type secretion rane fusion protein HlyD family [Caulobacteraceae bacterium]|nr:type secretion rane fusion protein HlyD family [Caulobacteraceae bacterium]
MPTNTNLLPAPHHLPAPAAATKDDGRLEVWIGCAIAAAFFVLFLGWAAFAHLDAAAYAEGEVAVAGHRQSVQHKEGGIVSALNVKEGQRVNAGDVLIQMAGVDAQAQESALAAQVLGLQAQRTRLQAEQFGLPTITWPASFATLTGDDRIQAEGAMKVQEAQFRARSAALTAQKTVLRQKSVELAQQINGFKRQIEASDEQRRLLGEELQGVQSLAAQGFAPQTRVRSLQRSQAELGGQRGQYAASIAQANEQSGESQLQILQLEKQRAEEVASQSRDVEFQLNDAIPKLSAARDQLARQQVRAPASGTVVGLSVFTPGGVISPGQKLMDIVPDKAALVVEARLAPSDADDVHIGREVEVKFPSLRDRTLPILQGTLTKLSADSFVDEKTGARYFQAEATVPPATLDRLKLAESGAFELKPGLPAQVMIPLHKRTALQYLTQPLTEAMWRSFREK